VFPKWDGKPIQMMEPERLPAVVERLLGMGYADADVGAILGGNWLRVAKACWK
jgi:membrane dipeptidase